MERSNNELLQSIRTMAWERAKGELGSIPAASYTGSEVPPGRETKMQKFMKLRDEFIDKVESEGLIEGV
ncbi:MAG: hypothetical protein CL666_08680 [Balneola sp.]|nr:hypothetical protein [Balneola sp.]